MESINSKQKEESIIPINESFNFNQDQEDIFNSSIHSSSNQKLRNIKYRTDNDIYNEIDVDPNFIDIKLKKIEEERRRKAVEEFEKRKLKENKENIIDYDEITEKISNKNKEDTQEEDEGIIIDNFNYISKPKINNISYKNSVAKKNNELEDLESKITQIKHISSYSKDDLNINMTPDKSKKENIKFKNNNNILTNINTNIDIIKESDLNSYTNLEINESNYNMNFYESIRKSVNENCKNNSQSVFENLVPNKSFKKFLNNKIRYYMDEKDIPTNFIKNLYSKTGIVDSSNSVEFNNLDGNLKSLNNDTLNLNFYTNENISNINIYRNENSNNMAKSNNIKRNKSMNIFKKNNTNSNKNYIFKNNKISTNYNKNITRKNNNNTISNKNYYNTYTNKNSNSNYKKVVFENKINKKKLEEMEKELNEQKNEVNEKMQKINLLENINDNLKQEMNILQQNFENERIDNSQNKKNYAMIKNCYNDIKNQYDLLNIKYMTLNDENFNFRRNKELYERQIALKNEMIENLIENKTNLQKEKVNNELNKINYSTKSSQKIISTFLPNNKENNKIEEKSDNNIKKENNTSNKNNNIDYTKYDKLTFPELQCKRDEFTKERKDINNIYSKIPLKTNNRELINKKEKLEKRLKEINCELMLVKLSIKNFKNHK